MLIAESHVFTTLLDLAVTYKNPSGAGHAPTNYVRLVYCLAYGESTLCQGLKGGTSQYWGIFGNLVGTTPKHVSGARRLARLEEKVRTLQLMQQAGIWLLDASLHGIYVPKGTRIDTINRKLTPELQRLWWEGYGEAIIAHAQPKQIIAIGKGLYQNMAKQDPFQWLDLPAPRRPDRNPENPQRRSTWAAINLAVELAAKTRLLRRGGGSPPRRFGGRR